MGDECGVGGRREEASGHAGVARRDTGYGPNWRKSSGRVRGISIRSRICAICLSRPPTAEYASFSTPRSTAPLGS